MYRTHNRRLVIQRVHNPKSVQLPTQPLSSAATPELLITRDSKGYAGKQWKVTTGELNPKQGCVQPSFYHGQCEHTVCKLVM